MSSNDHLPHPRGRQAAGSLPPILCLLFLAAAAFLSSCNKEGPASSAPEEAGLPARLRFESTGEEFLISALDEVQSIADYALRTGGRAAGSSARGLSALDLGKLGSALPGREHKLVVESTTIDTSYIYGELTPDGYGAVVTERHAYPKGLLLITVRKSHGGAPAKTVTETKRYITYQDFLDDTTQQSNITEIYGLSSDTIVTHVTRNGVIETYTFRLPVITRVTNPQDGSVRITSRYGQAGAVVSEVKDGDGNFIQLRKTSGAPDGGIVNYTLYADSSWRNVRTIGQSDGSVYREITSGP